MSGHSKWATIKRAKGAADAKRGNIFTKHAKLIAVAARRGGDPKMNPALRHAIDKAKEDNMPNANIDRAIKRGTGEDKDAAQIESVMYEGYGPGGIALLVKALTDNKNRTVSEVRNIFSKSGGNLGESGSVAWMFEERGVIAVTGAGESVELAAIEAGALDLETDGDATTVYTQPTELAKVRDALVGATISVTEATLTLVPKEPMKISDVATAQQIMKLMNALDENDDVIDIISNFEADQAVLAQLAH